jgi:pimeloyl-ACP methyl ester carboxylesterase
VSAGAEPAGISVYDRLHRNDSQLLHWLAAGTHAHEVATCIGETEYQLLAPLARQAAQARRDPDQRVLIIPGIMGSELGRPRAAPWPDDLLWIDPVDVSSGRLLELSWPDDSGTRALGSIPYTYFALKLRLDAAGFHTGLYCYDWRADIAAAGAALAAHIRALGARHVSIVAHSMGGLLIRAALRHHGMERVRRVVTLGTPHQGTLAAVQALRATYPTVRRLAALDPRHSAEQLTERVFHSFPSLYDLLPVAGALTSLDLFDAAQWPADGPRPDSAALRAAGADMRRPPGADARFHAIAGTGQRTATTLRQVADDFEYEISSDGDGTVAMASATLPGERNWFDVCEHSGLPRSERVAQATAELLRTGDTALLARTADASDAAHVRVTDAQLRATYTEKVDWRALSNEERGRYLNQLNLAPPLYRP